MKRLAAVILVAHLGACETPSDPYPITPGGGGGGTGTGTKPDAAVDGYDGDGGGMITGRVCLLGTNPHRLGACAASGAGGNTVELGTATATTADDGTFVLTPIESTTDAMWIVSGANIKSSAIQFSSTKTIPVFDLAVYELMLGSLNIVEGTGNGALMTRITRAGARVADATIAVQPTADSVPYYDGVSETDWQDVATGAYGVAWIPSIQAGGVSVTVTADETSKVVTGNQVRADTITFVYADLD